jgi:hypothetical protein
MTRMMHWVFGPGHIKGDTHEFRNDPGLENIVDKRV